MADDLDPAAVERAARAGYDASRDAAETEAWDDLPEWGRETLRAFTRAALAAAAAPTVETTTVWGFESPQPGLYYVTTNDMLIEVMHRARPEVAVLTCEVTPWREVPRG